MIFLKRYKRYVAKYTEQLPIIHYIEYGCKYTKEEDWNVSPSGSNDTTDYKTYLKLLNYIYELIDHSELYYSNDNRYRELYNRLTFKIFDCRNIWIDNNYYEEYYDQFTGGRRVGILLHIIRHNQKLAPVKGRVAKSAHICTHRQCNCE